MTVAPGSRPGRTGADARLLSAAATLATADFWRGHLQVWLDRTPLLPGDTTGTRAGVAPLVDPSGAPRGSVAVWGSVPRDLGTFRLVTGLCVAVLAVGIAVATGGLVGVGRWRRVFTALALAGVAGGVASVVGAVRSASVAATDVGLLRVRRVVEVAATGTRLNATVLTRLTAGLTITQISGRAPRRDSVVTRDDSGAWVVVVSRGRAWRLSDDDAPARRRALRFRLFALGLLTFLGTFGAAAFPPGADYLTRSWPPRAPA